MNVGAKLPKILVAVLCLAMLGTISVSAQEKVVAARRVLKALYPELSGKKFDITITDRNGYDNPNPDKMNGFGIDVRSQPDTFEQQTRPTTVLRSLFIFPVASDEPIAILSVSGKAANSDRVASLAEIIDSHQDWNDAAVREALAKANVKYGPDAREQLLKKVPIKELEPLVGELEIISAEFMSRDSSTPDGRKAARLTWNIQARTRKPGHPELKYYIGIEPFEGKLVSLARF